MSTPALPHSHAPTLIVFAKAPAPGQVKTRLTEWLTEAEAAALYEAFLQDALAQHALLARRHGAALRLYHAGPAWPERLTPEGASLHRQLGAGLGARMAAAFEESFAAGARSALLLGTDHPTLPPAFVEEGLRALEGGGKVAEESVCIGPSVDGGFYLLGMRRFAPQLFKGMSYSHAGVFAETLARAAQAGKEPVVLPEWYDVDRPADLRRLAAELSESDADCAPHTRRQIRALAEAYPALRGRAA